MPADAIFVVTLLCLGALSMPFTVFGVKLTDFGPRTADGLHKSHDLEGPSWRASRRCQRCGAARSEDRIRQQCSFALVPVTAVSFGGDGL